MRARDITGDADWATFRYNGESLVGWAYRGWTSSTRRRVAKISKVASGLICWAGCWCWASCAWCTDICWIFGLIVGKALRWRTREALAHVADIIGVIFPTRRVANRTDDTRGCASIGWVTETVLGTNRRSTSIARQTIVVDVSGVGWAVLAATGDTRSTEISSIFGMGVTGTILVRTRVARTVASDGTRSVGRTRSHTIETLTRIGDVGLLTQSTVGHTGGTSQTRVVVCGGLESSWTSSTFGTVFGTGVRRIGESPS